MDEVDPIINGEHKNSRSIRLYDRALQALRDIVAAIDSMEMDAVSVKAGWKTKHSALEALCQIGNLILRDDRELGFGIRTEFRGDTTLEDVMENMLCEMTEDERCMILNEVDDDGDSLMFRIERLLDEGQHYGIFNNREDLIRSVCGRTGKNECD